MTTQNNITRELTIEFFNTGSRKFRSANEIIKWAKEELTFWNDFQNRTTNHNIFGNNFLPDDIINNTSKVRDLANDVLNTPDKYLRTNLTEQLNTRFALFKNNKFPISSSPEGKKIKMMIERSNPDAAVVEYVKAREYSFGAGHITNFGRFLDAWDECKENGLSVKDAIAAQQAALINLQNEWEERFDQRNESWKKLTRKRYKESNEQMARAREWRDRFKRIALNLSKDYRDLLSEHDKTMKRMQQDFSTDMKLRAAEKFWGKKRKLNRLRSQTAFKKLGCVGGVGGIICVTIYIALYQYIGLPTGWSTGHTLAYVLPTLLFIWLLKIFANEYKTNLNLADDAEEREAMIFTFKALEHEGRVGDDERLVILNSLFRPYDKGAEESIPLPAWDAMINKMSK